MENILIPIAAMFLSVFLVVVYFSKANIKNEETKVYSRMLIVNLIYNVLCILTWLYAKLIGNELGIGIFQKLYMISMLMLIVYIIVYNIHLIGLKEKNINSICGILWSSLFIGSLFSFVAPLNVIYTNDVLDGNGMSYDIVLIFTVVYFLIIMMTSIYIFIKNKNNFSKDIPFVVLIILYLVGLVVRKFMPSLMFENFFFSFMLLIMYHTIENPDVKMLNEITLAKTELERANRVKREFLSSMSHEIRTPLNAIVGFSELAKYADTLEEAKENSSDIINASNDLMSMMDKMFEMFRIEREDSEIVEAEYHPHEILKEVSSLYENKMKNKNLEFVTNMDLFMPKLLGDADVVKKIVLNILDNAYKFTEKGSVTLTAKYEMGTLFIMVKDTGIGIKKEELKDIFTPFNKSSDTKNTAYSGMGLGLNITQKLIEKLDGKIEIQSEYGKGTKVIIKIKQKKVG